MRYVAFAVGFDGTLVRDGCCDPRCVDALRALSTRGRKLLLATSRELRELLEIFPQVRLFDFVIAENGAVMHRPSTRQSEILAQAPPEILLQELRRRRIIPLSVGSSQVTIAAMHRAQVRQALHKLQLDFQIVAGRCGAQDRGERRSDEGELMILPPGVDKASGVRAALKELGISVHNLVAIGDGENDRTLLCSAEYAVAVRNADAELRRVADRTTRGAYCDGFLELASELVATDR